MDNFSHRGGTGNIITGDKKPQDYRQKDGQDQI